MIYLTSVYWLEFLRLNMSTSVSTFNKLFGYLEDKTLQTDKNGIYRCITVMVSKLFNQFCKHMAAKPKNEARDRKLDTVSSSPTPQTKIVTSICVENFVVLYQ